MKRYNQKLFSKIFAICERDGALQNVGPEYYEEFLEIPKKGMESTI